MKLKFLGTAAAEGIPAMFCNCRVCQYAAKHKGQDIRTRSSVLIDDKIKIDFPPDSLYHSMHHGIRLRDLMGIFITHGHFDHFAVEELHFSGGHFVERDDLPKLKFFLPEDTLSMSEKYDTSNLELIKIKAYKEIKLGDYTITPIPAVHGDDEFISFNYIIENSVDTILYACDTGFYSDELLENFPKGKIISKLIMDCSIGCKKYYCENHMNIFDNLKFRNKLEVLNLLAPGCQSIITHFSHNANQTHKELLEFTTDKDIIVAYDGMKIT